MALRWIDGFDHYGSPANLYTAYEYYLSISLTSGRTGNGITFGASRVLALGLLGRLNWEPTEIWVGFAVWPIVMNISSYIFKVMDGANNTHCYVSINILGKIYIVDATATVKVESGTGVVSIGTWSYVELYCKLGQGGSGEVQLRVNGSLLLSDTTGDYLYGSATCIETVQLCTGVNSGVSFDDYYLDDSQFNGPIRIHTFFPDSDGTHSDFVRSSGSNDFEMVDDTDPDGDSTYIVGAAQGDKSTFGYTLSGLTDRIIGVQIASQNRKSVGGLQAKLKNMVRVGGSDYNSSVEKVLSDGYAYHQTMFSVNPDTSNTWDQTTVEAAEFGITISNLSTTTTT